jgi:polysaccharide export outer membrane protein
LALFALCLGSSVLRGQALGGQEQQLLHPGDSVRVVVWRQPELSGTFPVSAEGTLEHPLFQNVTVTGIPIDSARARLAVVIQRFVANPEFLMEPFFHVIVAGEVRLPGAYGVPRQATLVQAIAFAGGPVQDADMARVTLVRDGRSTVIDMTQPANPLSRALLLSGDEVVVPLKNNLLRNYLGPVAAMVGALAALTSVLIHH